MDTKTRAAKRVKRFVLTKSHPVCSSIVSEKRQMMNATAMVMTMEMLSGIRVKTKAIIVRAGSLK